MFVDASALVAIIAREIDAEEIAARLARAPTRCTSAVAIYEATLGLARSGNIRTTAAREILARFLDVASVTIISIDAELGGEALAAFERFGRGRHPARLNMGDCFSYACARSLGVPLLCKGDDFSQTDIELA